MADHGKVEYATAEGNDLPAHEATYENFIQLAYVGCLHIANILIGLAIIGVVGQLLVGIAVMLFATLVAVHDLMTGSKAPSAVMLVLSLLALALSAG
jgi:hypothetical protein